MLDPSLLDQMVQRINAQVMARDLELARAVGRIVLDGFFGGDYGAFGRRGRSRPVDFRALLARRDLLVGGAKLRAMVHVAKQLEQLPPELAARLPFAHHCALLPLSDPALKVELARAAIAERWDGWRLQREVRRRLPGSRAGRKRSPLVARAVPRVARMVDETAKAVASAELGRLDAQQLEHIFARLQQSRAALVQLEADLRQRLREEGSSSGEAGEDSG